MSEMPPDPWLDRKLEEAKKDDPGWVVFFGILAALVMLIIILGLVNMFCYWAFDWRVTF